MQKTVTVEGIEHPVILRRRKGTRNLRISLKSEGKVHVSVPRGIPEQAAKMFVRSKAEWINKHIKEPSLIFDNSHIGKSHILRVKPSDADRHSTKVTDTEIIVRLPHNIDIKTSTGQKIIKKACDKALLIQAKRLLPQRLEHLSSETGLDYRSCTIKKLKSRWGACDSFKNISLNSYLVQLDWELIDYVIYHELAHTVHAHHQKSFWDLVNEICPDYKRLRKSLKEKQTDVTPTTF